MNRVRILVGIVVAACALPAAAIAQTVIFTAEIDASQEVGVSTSPATGEAVMKYDIETNTFDLDVRLKGFSELVRDSHIHQAVAGVNGPIVVGFGGEAIYERKGDRLRLRIEGREYGGDPAQLLTGGAYLNFHTATFPAGAVRGQLLPHSAEFIAHLTPDQEVADVQSRARGLAHVRYDFLEDTVDAEILIFNFKNTLRDSHIHQAPAGVNGPIVVGFGGATVYRRFGNSYFGCFDDLPFNGSVAELLGGNAYVNVHSDVYPGGEIRGQLRLVIPRRCK